MLNQAGAHGSAINFNRQFPGSAEALVDGYEVPAAYTKAGWAEMKILFQNSGGFLPTENWVVEVPQAERARVQQELPSRYQHEFISQWSQFLQSAQVVPYRRPPEAAKKLALLSGSQSPLLELFCLTAQNVSVDSPQVTSAFQAVLSVVPPNCSIRYTGDPNNDYVTALFSLQQRFQELASNPTSGDAHAQLDPNITSAKSAVHQMETRFAIDPEWQIHTTVAKLLYDPITKAEQSIPNGADASAVCAEFSRLKSKYPFDPKGSDASLQEFEAFFQPKGVLWTFVEQNLRGLVAVAGNQYSGTGTKPIRPEFLQFLNRAAQVRDALYKTGGQRPEFRYSLRAYPSEGLKNVTLIIDGQTLQYESTKGDLKNFVWPANGQGAERQTELIGGTQLPPLELKGPWGIYRLLGDMQWNPQIGSERILEWTIRERQSDGPLLFNGKPITLRFGLSLEGPDIFQPGFLSGLNCISRVVQ